MRSLRYWKIRNWFRMLFSGELFLPSAARLIRRFTGAIIFIPELRGIIIRANGEIEHLGLLGRKLVTTAGKNFVTDAWQNLVELENMKFHGIGTGATAPAAGDTALQTELTTQYNPDNTRATGSLTEGAGANVFRTVGTNTVDTAATITEWGLLSQAATGGGTLFDRQTFTGVALAIGDSFQTTYDLTIG